MNQIACDECRTRKFRCSKGRPTCSYCSRQGKKCVYSARINRSPLTREYVTALERRLHKLEARFTELLPSVDIDTILTPESSSPAFNSWSLGGAESSGSKTPCPDPRKVEESSDILPEASNGFEWVEHEDLTTQLSDGMAALSVDPQGVGFIGSSANVTLLRSLHKNGWRLDSPSMNSLGLLQENEITVPWSWNILGQPSSHHQIENAFIEAYFFHHHTVYPIVHEATFRAQYNEVIPKVGGSSWILLKNVMASIGAWSIGHLMTDEIALLGHEISMTNDSCIFTSANLTKVQALALLGNFTQRVQNRPNTAWNYLGIAVRMAVSLGLHKEFPDWKISLLDREMRRRVWWNLYLYDSGASITLGRPILLPPPEIMDVKEPLNIHDEYLTPATTLIPTELDDPTIYSSMLVQLRFHKLVSPMYSRRIASSEMPADEVLSLNTKITNWFSTMPHYIREDCPAVNPPESLVLTRYRTSWRVRNFRILLLCPVLLRWATERARGTSVPETDTKSQQMCRQLCLNYAHQAITSIVEYFSLNLFSPVGDWYALYSLFQALWIPITAMLADPESASSAEWFADVEAAKQILAAVSARDPLARKFLDVVNRFCPPMEAFTSTETDEGAVEGGVSDQELLLDQIFTQLHGAQVASGPPTAHSFWG